ncbi:exonuclease RecJ [Halococcus qingdaonensis]|uniref:exonuclease RecJ n=1 Tax=Halococcus qingdaonensis TaxID=224402 RepID=UPI002116F678|nr:exonuclease RecJ [Halococcus qingdaonensis]
MAIAGRPEDSPAADSAADALREAAFVRLLASDDADSLAAAGLLGRALAERDVPFQARVTGRDTAATDDATTVHIGIEGGDLTLSRKPSASETAVGIARDLGGDPDPALALAGSFPTGFEEGSTLADAREHDLVEQRPGVTMPVDDLVDGLAHTTLVRAPFSGDEEAAAAALDGRDDPREIASLLALLVASADNATPRAAESVARALRPYTITGNDERMIDERPATVGGYADVLRACARERPGVGLALALGHDVWDAALAAWRTHGERAHAALDGATTERHRGLFVARVDDAPLATVARLLCDFRSPEPVALAVSETRAAAAASDEVNIGERMDAAAAAAGGDGDGSARRGRARFEDADTFVTAFREASA